MSSKIKQPEEYRDWAGGIPALYYTKPETEEGLNMNTVLKSFDVVKDGKVLAHFELFKQGFRNEVRTASEVIYTGAGADQYYQTCLEDNKKLAEMIGGEIVE